jgi:hypothetical protein
MNFTSVGYLLRKTITYPQGPKSRLFSINLGKKLDGDPPCLICVYKKGPCKILIGRV